MGLRGALVDPFAYAAAIIIVGLLFANALWSRGLTTFADLFRQRYSPGVERLVVIVLLPGSIIWAAAQIRAFGQVMDANSGMGLKTAIVLAAVLVGAYSVVGGLLADSVTDVIQGIVVLAGLIILGAIVGASVGGVPAGLAQVEPERLGLYDPEDGVLGTLEKIAIPICGTIVAVELISRFLGARTAEIAGRATVTGGLIYLTIGLVPVFLGLMGPTAAAECSGSGADRGQAGRGLSAGPALHRLHRRHHLGNPVGGAFGSARARGADLPQPPRERWCPASPTAASCGRCALTVLVLSIVAFVISFSSEGIKELVETASAFGSAGVFVATLFALFTRFGGPLSAYASVGAGMIVWAGGKYGLGLATPYLFGLLAALAGYVGAALIDNRR